MTTKKIARTIVVIAYKKSEYWVAYCPELKIFGFSKKNINDAISDFEIALKTFLEVHAELGTIVKSLIKLGWIRENDTFLGDYI